MLGSATPTMETSSPSRNRTPHSTRRVIHARRSNPTGDSVDGERAFMTRNHMQMQISTSKLIRGHGSAKMHAVSQVDAAADPVEAWRALSAAHANVHTALEVELRRRHGLSAVEFEVLDRLARCSEGKVRMAELAENVHLTQSTCSRVVARLEDERLACRAMCDADRRGIYASVTDAGRERVTSATPTYRDVIAARLGAP